MLSHRYSVCKVKENRSRSCEQISIYQGNEMAKMAQAATMINPSGNPYLIWSSVSWNAGALWMINANPDLPGEINGYTMYYSEEKLDARYLSTPKVNGQYLDTLDGSAHTLNYYREHFRYAIAPLPTRNSAVTEQYPGKSLICCCKIPT